MPSFIRLETDDGPFADLLAQEGSLTWFILLEDSYTMSDQIEIQLPVTRVPEATGFTAVAYYRTRTTQSAATPTTIHYRVDCLTSKTTLKDWTSIAPSTNNSISITSTMNAIQMDINKSERKQIIVQSDRGLDTQATGSARWVVDNLYGIGGGL